MQNDNGKTIELRPRCDKLSFLLFFIGLSFLSSLLTGHFKKAIKYFLYNYIPLFILIISIIISYQILKGYTINLPLSLGIKGFFILLLRYILFLYF